MLDGSVNSCRALFDDLGVFWFSTKNIEKTQAMWIGLNVNENDAICSDLPMQWVKKCKYSASFSKMTMDLCVLITLISSLEKCRERLMCGAKDI